MFYRKALARELHHTLTELELFSWELEHEFGPFIPLQKFEGSLFSTLRVIASVHSQLSTQLVLSYAEHHMLYHSGQARGETSKFLESTWNWLAELSGKIVEPLRKCLYMDADREKEIAESVERAKGVLIDLRKELHRIVYELAPANWGG